MTFDSCLYTWSHAKTLSLLHESISKEFPADTTVVALGLEPLEFNMNGLEKAGIEVYTIGDAKEIHGIAEATREGFLIGTRIEWGLQVT